MFDFDPFVCKPNSYFKASFLKIFLKLQVQNHFDILVVSKQDPSN